MKFKMLSLFSMLTFGTSSILLLAIGLDKDETRYNSGLMIGIGIVCLFLTTLVCTILFEQSHKKEGG